MDETIEKAIVLCGGRGQRLRPYTDHTPKPLLKIGDKPVLEYVIANLKKNGVKEVFLAVGYLGEMIESYFGDGKELGIKIKYKYEEKPLNTAGALKQFKEDELGENFFVVAGDHLTSWNLREMGKHHLSKKPIVTIGLIPKELSLEYGIAEVEGGYIKGFKEKPMKKYLINTGIYAMNKKILGLIKEGEDFSKHVFPRLLEKNEKILAYIDNREFWMDIGRVKDYERMNELLSVIRLESKLFRGSQF